MKRVSSSEAERLSELRSTLGDRTLRQLLSQRGSRLVRPDRLDNLIRGTGRLSEADSERLQEINRNRASLRALKARGKGKQEFKVNRSMQTWIISGKAKGAPNPEDEDELMSVIKSLWYLGVDPQDGSFYKSKGKT